MEVLVGELTLEVGPNRVAAVAQASGVGVREVILVAGELADVGQVASPRHGPAVVGDDHVGRLVGVGDDDTFGMDATRVASKDRAGAALEAGRVRTR